jgi:GntR family transcriptional regulator / MocR family aminotransferase
MTTDWSSGLDLLLGLDRTSGLRHGIERAIRDAIRSGRLPQGAVLPSSRSLAHDLGVARGTVSAAYRQLSAAGYLSTRQGAAVRVSWVPPRRMPLAPAPAPVALRQWDLRPGRPDSASFPRTTWARAHQKVLAKAPSEIFGYGNACGSAELRSALAEYLGRARGVDTSPAHLLICNGFTQALMLICLALRARGAATLAVEDPGVPHYRQLTEPLGLQLAPVPCDAAGLRTDYLERTHADAVLVTPAHQYPLGVTMSAARRTRLIEWARRHDALIIEDDYDGEFRYDRQPVGALQQLDHDHVIYAGTASKTLAPGLRLGWLSVPESLGSAIGVARQSFYRGTGILEQLTLAELITSGEYDRHIRRMRAEYKRRRDELARALAVNVPHLRLAGISAGLHALIYLPGTGPTEQQVQSRASRLSLALHTLGRYWHTRPESSPQAIIVGYATPAGHAYRPALGALIELLEHDVRVVEPTAGC